MRYILFIAFFVWGTVSAQTIQDLKNELKKLSTDKDLKNATIGFYAMDLDSNKSVASWDENRSLVPASTMKLVTTATTLELLGKNKRFSTSIAYTGNIDSNSILNGDVYIIGGGDPSLGAQRFRKHYGDFINQWANELIKLGVDSINGQVIGDASFFDEQMVPSTWGWSDIGNYYGAGPSGLSIYENIYTLHLSSGKKQGDVTSIDCINPYIPDLKVENLVVSSKISRDQSYIFGAPYQDQRVIKGAIPLNRSEFTVKGSIPDPAHLTAFELDMELRRLGIKIAHSATTVKKKRAVDDFEKQRTTLITTTYSPQLISLIQQTNLYSINLYAEHFMNHIGIHKYKSGDTQSGTTATTNFWRQKGVDVEGMYINDGSGLSRFNAITAKQMVSILSLMYQSNNYNAFLKTLPVAGKSGTLRNVGKGTIASGKVKAKSGYMTRVRSYSGYVKTVSDRNIAFAIIVNNYNCSAYQMKKKMEKIMVILAKIEK